MTDAIQTSVIVDAGMKLLRENLGLIEAEIFVAYIKKDRFDYTEWSQNLYTDIGLEELLARAAEYERENDMLIPEGAQVV